MVCILTTKYHNDEDKVGYFECGGESLTFTAFLAVLGFVELRWRPSLTLLVSLADKLTIYNRPQPMKRKQHRQLPNRWTSVQLIPCQYIPLTRLHRPSRVDRTATVSKIHSSLLTTEAVDHKDVLVLHPERFQAWYRPRMRD